MEFERTTDTDEFVEWERADGHATIRCRERADGRFVVRYDQLHQADDGRGYASETVESREAAKALVETWQATTPV